MTYWMQDNPSLRQSFPRGTFSHTLCMDSLGSSWTVIVSLHACSLIWQVLWCRVIIEFQGAWGQSILRFKALKSGDFLCESWQCCGSERIRDWCCWFPEARDRLMRDHFVGVFNENSRFMSLACDLKLAQGGLWPESSNVLGDCFTIHLGHSEEVDVVHFLVCPLHCDT